MKQKIRQIGPVILLLIILGACAGGGWIWYDNNVDRSGWVEQDGIRFYRDFHADPVSGWLTLDDGRYYFQEGGIPHTGWLEDEGYTYYFRDDGTMHTGWLEEGEKIHYFGDNGHMMVGWLWIEADRFYLQDGVLATGWQTIDGNVYYFDRDGCMVRGFAELENGTYYFDDGIMSVGPKVIGEQHYLFGSDGTMFTGWLEQEDAQLYYRPDGTQAFGWEEIDGKRVYFDEQGHLCQERWVQEGEYRYYLYGDGSHAVGPTVIDGKTHYFTPKGIEVVLVNALNPIPEDIAQTIVNFKDYHDVDSRCYEPLKKMLNAYTAEVGIDYTFNSAHRTWREQTNILELRTLEHMRDFDLSFYQARKKALETVAIPGTSEHQLGLSVDLVGYSVNQWLAEHCWEYGFILRYPEGKENITGIINEPWHFRYVGVEVSMDMKDSGLCLEEYLGAEPVTPEAVAAYHGDTWYQEKYPKKD